ncbi:MAG: enoyl-CoA hydratase/isomerase family protein [Thermoplasmata archaeon]|nr:MAG: enoyl-CoA hydratase/isomerase family protein [Thermoplasmata archaeon]
MEQVWYHTEEGVAIIRLAKSVTNAIGMQLVNDLWAKVKQARDDDEVHAVMLTGESDRFFSIGLDIPELIEYPKDKFAEFVGYFDRMCMDLYAMPKPTVVAIRGHATAGGAIIALTGDHRVMTSGRAVMGLNEVRLGVTVPYPADRMLRDLVGNRVARDVMEVGDFYEPSELLAMGLVDEVVPPDQVLFIARELAVSLAASPTEAYAAIKENRTAPVLADIETHLEQKEREFVDMWYSDHAQAQLEEAMLKF